jgi:hypothetical protein
MNFCKSDNSSYYFDHLLFRLPEYAHGLHEQSDMKAMISYVPRYHWYQTRFTMPARLPLPVPENKETADGISYGEA